MIRFISTSTLIFSCLLCVAQSMKDSVSLEQVVITSQRVSTTSPSTFQNIELKTIDKINLGQDPVVLIQRLSPSIVSYSDGGTDIGNYSQFRLRGIDQSRINISLNGVPLNDMADHGTFFSNFSDFGNSVQSIQIQRGAGLTQRGLASYGGAVNFESMNVFGERNGEAQITFGSFSTLRTAAEFNTGLLDNDFGFYGRMTRTESDGFKYNSGSDSYSLFFSGGKLGDNDMFKLTAFTGKTQNGQSYLNVPLSIIESDPRTNFNDLNDIDDFEQSMIHVQYARFLKDGGNLTSNLYYNSAGGVFPFSFGGDQFMFGLENDHYGVFINYEKPLTNSKLSFGAHGYVFDRENFEYITPLVTMLDARDFTDKDEISAYAKYDIDISNWNLFANAEIRTLAMDIRGDQTLGVNLSEENSWTFFNGSFGATYQFSDYNNVYASIARTNREPTRSDVLNGVLSSESVVDLEFGWRLNKEKLKANINGFIMSFDNEITSIGALQELSYIEIRQNVANSSRIGLEALFDYEASEVISTNLSLAWMNSNIDEYDNGSQIFENVQSIFTPTWVISPTIVASVSDKTTFTLNGRYVSESFSELSNNEDFVLPSHFILNAQLDFTVFNNLRASVMLNNAFDVLYFTEGGPIDSDFDGLVEGMGYRVQPPRHVYLMLKYSF